MRAFIKHTTTGVSNRSRPWNKSYAYLRSRVNGYEVTIKTFIIFFSFFHNTNTLAASDVSSSCDSLILFLWHFYSFCLLLRPFHVLLLTSSQSHHACYHISLYFLYSFLVLILSRWYSWWVCMLFYFALLSRYLPMRLNITHFKNF